MTPSGIHSGKGLFGSQPGKHIEVIKDLSEFNIQLRTTRTIALIRWSGVNVMIAVTMPIPSGMRIDGYEVIGLLGAGGMGEVYRARDPVLKRDVAIKVLPPVVVKDPERLQRFQQEAQAAAALNHPNILVIYQFGSHEGSPYSKLSRAPS